MTRAEWRKRRGRSSSVIRKSLRFAIYARDNFDCVYCRQVFPPDFSGAGLTLDHVVPRSQGGGHGAGNLVTACVKCNSTIAARQGYKGIALPDGVRRTRARIRRQLRKPVNRELGRWLARMAKAGAVANLCYPRTSCISGEYGRDVTPCTVQPPAGQRHLPSCMCARCAPWTQ